MKHFNLRVVAIAVLLVISHAAARADETQRRETDVASSEAERLLERGRTIYVKTCADCHGDQGQGVAGTYDAPLVGDDSIGELAKRIAETMPEEEPAQCVGEDAAAVAAYLHHAFYSEAARIRNRPPRITLTHLTGNQLRQSLTDLYTHFSGSMWLEPKRGLQGKYFTGARYRRENKKIERIDATIDFNWMHDGPGEGIKAEEFFVQWRGGLKVDETGRYEIVIRSTCAFVCKFGQFDREFINNHVQSGEKIEFRRSIVLTAGRVYPIQIELIQRKRKTEQPPARITLAWIPPHGIESVVPAQSLLPASPPATYSLQARLPPDDRSYGYDRGLRVDRQWDGSTTAAAVEFAQVAVEELWPSYRRKHRRDSDENRARLRNFLTELAETAFRGPLDDAERHFYIDQQIEQTQDDAEAIKRCLLVALKSPRFLYPGLDRDRSPSQRAANRLALILFDSLPADQWLIKLAREDKLRNANQVRAAASRMVADYRARGKTRELMYAWLNLGHIGDITKASEHFPDYSADVVADSKASLNAFLDEVVWGESGDFRQLFLADWAYTTPRLNEFYGTAWTPRGSAEGEEESVKLARTSSASDLHFGLLSHPYLMSGLAYEDSTSPIHRGVFLIRYMLGRTLRPPQEAFTPLAPDLHPEMTTRQRVELQTSPQNCQVCHNKINGLGFALENFDAVGRFRTQEGDKPIDPAGHYATRDGRTVAFRGPGELARYLASSDDAHRAFVNRAFLHFVKQPIAAYGPDRLDQLTVRFRKDNFRIRELLVEIAVLAASQHDPTSDEEF